MVPQQKQSTITTIITIIISKEPMTQPYFLLTDGSEPRQYYYTEMAGKRPDKPGRAKPLI